MSFAEVNDFCHDVDAEKTIMTASFNKRSRGRHRNGRLDSSYRDQ